MSAVVEYSRFHWFGFLRDAALRTGIYTGVLLSLAFAAWLLVANRAPFLEPLALERNILGASLLGLFACVPVIRFLRSPSELMLSGLLGWGLFAFTYRIFCFKFVLLEQYYSAFHVFVLGAISYFVFATLSWIGTIVWRVYATSGSHMHH